MKKISLIALMLSFVAPAVATEAKTETTDSKTVIEEQPLVEPEIKETEISMPSVNKSSNPDIRFPRGLQFGLGVSGTSGLNGFVGYNNKNFDSFWAKRFGVRFDFASMSPIRSKLNSRINSMLGDDGAEIDDNLNINNVSVSAKHFGALIDFYPFGNTWFAGGLRLSTGYVTGKTNVDADIFGKVNGGKIEFELGGRKYYYEGDVMQGKAKLDWKYDGPYLGAGFDLGIYAGFKIYFDAGIVFAGNGATIDLDVPINEKLKDITSGTPEAVTGTIETEYEKAKAKALADAQNELNKIDYYPLVKLGFMYRF